VGVLSIVAHGEAQRLRELTLNIGDFWILASVLAWSAYTLLLSKRPPVHPLAFLAAISVTGLIFLFPFYVWEMAQGHRLIATPGSIAGIVYTGVGSGLPRLHSVEPRRRRSRRCARRALHAPGAGVRHRVVDDLSR
jgi:drug/metabolite transporter (DMT)-like permease